MTYVKFKRVELDQWVCTLPNKPPTSITKEIIEKYIIPHADEVYHEQMYFTLDVEIAGFGVHELNMELYHTDKAHLSGAYIGIGGRDSDAFCQITEFELPYPEEDCP